jgi:predicted HTH domain antitoxin
MRYNLADMTTIKLNLPDESLLALHLEPDKAEAEIRLVAAVKLFEMGKLSTGAAARFAGLPVPVFVSRLSQYGVSPFNQSPAEIAEDIERAARRQ